MESFGALLDRGDLVLVTCPESLDLPAPERSVPVRYVGPLLEPPGADAGWRPPGADDGRPLVVAGLGTTVMDELPVLQRVVAALGAAPVRGIVTLGDHLDPDDLEPPDDVLLTSYVRHAALLPWASAVVTHAGLGTVLAGLAHGLPLVCLPLGREQPANAEAVARVGAGVVLDPASPPSEIADGDRPRRHRSRAPRRGGSDGGRDRRAPQSRTPPCTRSSYSSDSRDRYVRSMGVGHRGAGLRLPDFLVLGVPKAGTTTLARWLADHPGCFVPPEKELDFFNLEWHTGLDAYAARFAAAPAHVLVGEATPGYLLDPGWLGRIAVTLPNARFVVILAAHRHRLLEP